MIAARLKLFSEVLAYSLKHAHNIAVVQQGSMDGREAVDAFRRSLPDVVLLDYFLSGLDGPEATREMRAASPDAKVLILAGIYGPDEVERALAAGAVGFLPKSLGFSQLVDAIRQAHRDRPLVYPDQLANLVDELKARIQEGDELYARCGSLTDRELAILRQLSEGSSTSQVAANLAVSAGTVKNQLTRIFSTLGAGSRMEAIDIARRSGFLDGRRAPED